MEDIVFCYRFGSVRGYFGVNADKFMLEPVGCQNIVAVGPLCRRPAIILRLPSGRRFHQHGDERELVVSKDALPFRCMT
jgi:hypothetical protein